jgi:hypothetical protein
VNSETDDFALSGVILMVARCVVTTRVVVIIKSTRFMACNMKTWRREHRCTKTKKKKKESTEKGQVPSIYPSTFEL